jgi:hypothetical protein
MARPIINSSGSTAELRYYDTDKSKLDEPFEGRLVGAIRAKF